MNKATLLFAVNKEYEQSINGKLAQLSVLRIWDPVLKRYLYTFPISKLKEVESLIGKIEIKGYTDKIKEALISIPKWKGKDIVELASH
jgi:hypothetical protein